MPDFTKAKGSSANDKKKSLNANLLKNSTTAKNNIKYVETLNAEKAFMDDLPTEDKNEITKFLKIVNIVNSNDWDDASGKTVTEKFEEYNKLVDEINKTMHLYSAYKEKDKDLFIVKFGKDAKEVSYTYGNLLNALKKEHSGQYGHEFSDLINDKSTESKIYYSESGALKELGKVKHSSSRNGHSIFWTSAERKENGKDVKIYTILAIGKHNDSDLKGLAKGAVYTILEPFDSIFKDYKNKIVGFK